MIRFYKIKVWIVLGFIVNIPVTSSCQCLSGIYTVGGGMNYTTLHAAVVDLRNNGVCGPVTFQIKDGIHFVTDTLPAITGASAVNTITFTSLSGDSSLAILEKMTPGPDVNFRLDGGDYIHIDHLTLRYTIDFLNGADHNEVSYCLLKSGQAIRSFNNTKDEYNIVHHNIFDNVSPTGYPVVNLNSANFTLEQGNEISNNIFHGTAVCINQVGMVVNNNVFDYTTTGGNGFLSNSSDTSFYFITNNKVYGKAGSGIMIDCHSTPVSPTVIANNFIQAGDSSFATANVKGIHLANGHFNVYHNSVNVIACANSAALFLDKTWNPYCDIKNNCFVNAAGGLAAQYNEWVTPFFCTADYNVYYTTGDTLIKSDLYGSSNFTWHNTLGSWINYIGLDSNSVQYDPFYTSNTDLHANGEAALHTGTYLAGFPADIDGDARNNPPCIGADEYTQATIHYVWPGDCNNDLTANNIDFLYVGLAYLDVGNWRYPITDVWAPWRSVNWANSFASGLNHKYADSNGDGAVEIIDTNAISLNYGLTHPARMIHSYNSNKTPLDLKFVAATDTIGPNNYAVFDIVAGSAAQPVPALYGMAFSLQFDPLLVDSIFTAVDYSVSALGNYNSDFYSLTKDFASAGSIGTAICKFDQANSVNVNGSLGKLLLKVAPGQAAQYLQVSLSNVFAITAQEDTIEFITFPDSVFFDPNFTGITEQTAFPDINIQYKPDDDYAIINCSGKTFPYEIALYSAGGQVVETIRGSRNIERMDMRHVQAGIYVLKVSTGVGTVCRKITVPGR